MKYGLCRKFCPLSSSAKVLKIGYDLTKLLSKFDSTFSDTQCMLQFSLTHNNKRQLIFMFLKLLLEVHFSIALSEYTYVVYARSCW